MSEFVKGPALEGLAVSSGSFVLSAEVRPLPALDAGVWLSPDASLLPLNLGTAPGSARPLTVGEDGVYTIQGSVTPGQLGGVFIDLDPSQYRTISTQAPAGAPGLGEADLSLTVGDAESVWIVEATTFAFGGWMIL